MNTLPFPSITAWARASNFQSRRFLSSQCFPDRATYAQTNSRAPSVVLNQIDDLWSPSTFHLARDRRSSCRILPCHLVAHAKLRRPGHFVWQAIELRLARAARWARAATNAPERSACSGKQGLRHCLEVWSFLSLRRMGESSAGDFHGWQNTEDFGGSELQKCTVNRKGISFTNHQQPMNRITLISVMNSRLFIWTGPSLNRRTGHSWLPPIRPIARPSPGRYRAFRSTLASPRTRRVKRVSLFASPTTGTAGSWLRAPPHAQRI